MRSVRCERCGFVQAERATCRKCGDVLLGIASAAPAPSLDDPGSSRQSWDAGAPETQAAASALDAAQSDGAEPRAAVSPPQAATTPAKPPKPAPEPIARLRSVPLTADLDPRGAVLVEFRCRKCDQYGVILVPPELMETGIEGECGTCRRSAPMTRVELAAKRFDQPIA